MHELSVAQAIVTIVAESAGAARVEQVDVVVGALSGVVPTALEFVWDVAVAGTSLAGARLVIDAVPTTVHCRGCDDVVEPELGFVCPRCGTLSGDVRSGQELEVRSVTLLDEQPAEVTR